MNSTMMMLLAGVGAYLFWKNSSSTPAVGTGTGASSASGTLVAPVSSTNPINQTVAPQSNFAAPNTGYYTPNVNYYPTEDPRTATSQPSPPPPSTAPIVGNPTQPGVVTTTPAPPSSITLNPTNQIGPSMTPSPVMYAPGPLINYSGINLSGLGGWRV